MSKCTPPAPALYGCTEKSFFYLLVIARKWLHQWPSPYAKWTTCSGKRTARQGHYHLLLSLIVHTFRVHTDRCVETFNWSSGRDPCSAVFAAWRWIMSEVVGGGGWSRRITRLRAESFTREQARQESNLRLPHLFPPFLCISTELQFIQILLNELFCIYLCYTQRILSIFKKKGVSDCG